MEEVTYPSQLDTVADAVVVVFLAPALTDTMTVYVCFTPLPWRSVKQTHPVPIKRNRKSAGYSFAVCQKAKTDINKIKYAYART